MKAVVRPSIVLLFTILVLPIIVSILSAFLRFDIETFECWCRSDSISAGSTVGLAAVLTGNILLVTPASLSTFTNTSNLPSVSADTNTLMFTASSSQYAAVRPVPVAFSSGFSVIVKVMFIGTPGSWERIFDCGSGSGNNNFLLARNGTSNNLVAQIYSGGNASGYCTASGVITQNQTLNVALIYDPSVGGGTLSIYIGGVLTGSLAALSQFATDRTPTSCYIGRSLWPSDAYANMNLYRFAMYNRVLTLSEITQSATQ